MVQVKKLLKMCHWNVEGLKVNNESNKLQDKEFIDQVKMNDIICLSETHCGEKDVIDIDGYHCFKLCRKVTKKINRYFGGIAVLYKKELKEGIQFLTHKNDDYVWKKLSKSYFGLDSDYYVCLAYIPPENSRYYKDRNQDTLEYIESDIVKYSNMGHVMLIGDLNARTGIENDYVLHDANNMLLNNVSYDIDAEANRDIHRMRR
jgi:exonuclease III